jgi:hypothetical protein
MQSFTVKRILLHELFKNTNIQYVPDIFLQHRKFKRQKNDPDYKLRFVGGYLRSGWYRYYVYSIVPSA